MILNLAVLILLVGTGLGCIYMLLAAALVPSLRRREPMVERTWPAVSILKPLHGDEPALFDNLSSFCTQDYPGPVQILFGVADANDPAVATVRRLQAAYPGSVLELVVDSRVTGSNPKVSNLANMSGRIASEIVVLADSDIRVPPDYLKRIVSGLDRFGAVTCPYVGLSSETLWSQLSRMNIDGYFLPGVLVGSHFGLSRPCMGSTIALRRSSLEAIGGFAAVADSLADDYALGAALAARGEAVALLPLVVAHMCSERTLGELWRHELRWALAIRSIDPVGYVGWTVGHAFPLALLVLALGGGWAALSLACAAVLCRAVLLAQVSRSSGLPAHPYWLIPVRDLLCFAVFVAAFVARDVSWRGQRYRLNSQGNMMPERRSSLP